VARSHLALPETRIVTSRLANDRGAAEMRFRVARRADGWTIVDGMNGREVDVAVGDDPPLLRMEAEILCGCLNASQDPCGSS